MDDLYPPEILGPDYKPKFKVEDKAENSKKKLPLIDEDNNNHNNNNNQDGLYNSNNIMNTSRITNKTQ